MLTQEPVIECHKNPDGGSGVKVVGLEINGGRRGKKAGT